MDVYGQDAEVRLLSLLVQRLDLPTMIDVGAERGSLAEELLQAGVERLYAFDPHPANASALRERFARDPRTSVYEYAVSNEDGNGELHVSTKPGGAPIHFGHTLLERGDTEEIAWTSTLPVSRRSLGSLVASGELPERVGLLKIDTEGHDLEVIRGMGSLCADVVMVEHWADLPNGLGRCPWTTEEMVSSMRARGFTHFGFVVHREEFVTLKWDDGEVEDGAMGNLVFLHDDALVRLLPIVLECAGELAEHAVGVGQTYMRAANDRAVLVEELKRVTDERSLVIEEVARAAEERLALVNELDRRSRQQLARIRELEGAAANDRERRAGG